MLRDAWLARYRALGLATVALRPRGKRPLRRGWLVPDESQWKSAPRNANVGILTGRASGGLVVLDFDTEDGPFDALGLRPLELARQTMVVKTARGWHVYARADETPTLSPKLGLDVRGDGALVVAPPSIHPSGCSYELLGEGERIAPLTSFAGADLLRPPAPSALDLEHVEEWIAAQWPGLRAHWERLKGAPGGSWDPSKSDFAVARCLWEGGYDAEAVATILCSLPGSRAAQRGQGYALRTAQRAQGSVTQSNSSRN